MRGYRFVVTVVCATLLSACASPGSRPTSAPAISDPVVAATPRPTWFESPGDKPGEIVYPGTGLRSMPAPASARPAVSAAKIEIAARQAAMVRVGLAAPDISLLMVRSGDFAGSTLSKPSSIGL
jgi:hypothetical protein